MSVVSEEKIWDAMLLSIAHYSPFNVNTKTVRMNTLVSKLFDQDAELFRDCLMNVFHHLREHENIPYYELDIPTHYLFNSFTSCRSVFFYFFLKINGLEEDALQLLKDIGNFKQDS